MIKIPRKSKFDLTQEEKEYYSLEKGKVEGIEPIHGWKRGLATGKETKLNIRDNVYNAIGIDDYYVYSGQFSSYPQIKTYLKNRAIYSAILQVLEDEIREERDASMKKGDLKRGEEYDIDRPLVILEPNVEYSTLYHGTISINITEEQLGQKGADGIYPIREGITYWKTNAEEADTYRKRNKDGSKRDTINPESQRLERKVKPNDRIKMIQATNGGMCFEYQEEFMKLCGEGVRYLIRDPNTEDKGDFTGNDALEISRFGDFVRERDKKIQEALERYNLRLPYENEKLSDYLESIDLSTNKKQVIDLGKETLQEQKDTGAKSKAEKEMKRQIMELDISKWHGKSCRYRNF